MTNSYPYECVLLKGAEVLDDGCRCTFSRISRESPFGGKFEGEGSIRISKLGTFTLRAKEPSQFTLRFNKLIIPGVGELVGVPVVLVPDDLFGSTTAAFKIGTI